MRRDGYSDLTSEHLVNVRQLSMFFLDLTPFIHNVYPITVTAVRLAPPPFLSLSDCLMRVVDARYLTYRLTVSHVARLLV